MKIAYLCADVGVPLDGSKGASVHLREMIHAWVKLGHEVVLFTPNTPPGDGFADVAVVTVPQESAFEQVQPALKRLEVQLDQKLRVRQDLRNLGYNLAFFDQAGAWLQDQAFDFIYERYTLFHHAGIDLARQFHLPHILEVNAPLCQEQEQMRGLDIKALAHQLEQKVLTESDQVIVVSDALRQFAQALGVDPQRILTLPNGVDPEKFSPDVADGQSVRQHYKLDGKDVIGFIGTLKPWHGVDSLVKAVALLKEQRPDVHVLIVGDGPQRPALEQQVHQADLNSQVTFTGTVPYAQMPDHIAALDIAVAPYVEHADFYFSPIKLFEYMALEKPVVAAGLGQVRDIIRQDETGILYEPGNVAELGSALGRLLDDPSRGQQMGERARQQVVRQHTWTKNAERVISVAERLIDRPSVASGQKDSN